MKKLIQLITGGLIKDVGKVIDNLTTTDEERLAAKLKIEELLEQMRCGDLDYDDKYVYWKGKKIPRSSMNEGAKNLPWEKEAYNNA